jgi:hypothetical protein
VALLQAFIFAFQTSLFNGQAVIYDHGEHDEHDQRGAHAAAHAAGAGEVEVSI